MPNDEVDGTNDFSKKSSFYPKLLKAADLTDNFTHALYKIAPYKGCAHGCRYCDGRAERYFFDGDFERDIEIRHSIPDRLAKDLPGIRERGMIAFGSGVTDPYQPVEAFHNLTGRCAGILATSPTSLPAMVMTKSSLAMRDLPLWQEVNRRAGFLLLVSLTSLDENIRREMEPQASSFGARLDMLRAFKKAGCTVGVLAMPFLPGISDDAESIRQLYAACVDVGVDFVMPGGLTLRPGRQKEFYLKKINSYRPWLLDQTLYLYREERQSGAPSLEASQVLYSRIGDIRKEFNIPYLLPYNRYVELLPTHDAVRVLFRDMIELYNERNINTSALAASANSYDTWLISLRRVYRRRRTLPNDWIEQRFAEAATQGELRELLANDRLSRFITSILYEGARLNYNTLKLE